MSDNDDDLARASLFYSLLTSAPLPSPLIIVIIYSSVRVLCKSFATTITLAAVDRLKSDHSPIVIHP
jgi:hypothetical protein